MATKAECERQIRTNFSRMIVGLGFHALWALCQVA